MKKSAKLLCGLTCVVLMFSMLCVSSFATVLKQDDLVLFKVNTLDGSSADPYLTGTDDDTKINYYTWNNGKIAMDGDNITVTCDSGGNDMFEAVIIDPDYHIPVDQYKFLKIRYKSSAKSDEDPETTYYMPSNETSCSFNINLSGEWETLVLDLNSFDDLAWSAYIDDYDQSASLGTNKVRSFRFDFPKIPDMVYTIDYVAFLTTAEDAELFDGTVESLNPVIIEEAADEAPAADTAADTAAPAGTTAAPQTSDFAFASLMLLAAASAIGAIVVSKRK